MKNCGHNITLKPSSSMYLDLENIPYTISGGVPAKVIRFRFTIDEIIEHEKSLYPKNERYTREELEKIFIETKIKNNNK